MMRIQIVTAMALLLLLTGCQATIQIVPNTPTVTPTLRPGEFTPTPTATWVSIFEDTATPGPAATATPTWTATAAPVDTATPAPTLTPAPTDTATPEPTATAEPTDTATPEPTATAAPADTATPEPTATLEPTSAPTDTATPKPTATKAPTSTPTPKPTQTPTPVKAAAALPTRTPTPRPPATIKPAPQATPTKSGLAAAAAAAGTPTPSSFSQALSQDECNKLIQEAVAKNPSLPVSNLACDFQPGQAVITGRAKIGFFGIDLAITVVVDVANCKATPRISKVDPAMAQAQVDAALQPYLGQIADVGADVCVQKVTITDNALTIEGTQ